MKAQQIIAQASLGAIIEFSNGQPKPPARFTRKLAAWENENGTGQLTEKRTGEQPQFTLHIASYTSNGIKIIEMFRTFSDTSRHDFTIMGIPDAGSFLVLRHRGTSQMEELLHIAESQEAAERWLADHHNPGAIIQQASPVLEPALYTTSR